MLRKYGSRIGIDPSYTILDEEDSRQLLGVVMTEHGFKKKDDKYMPKAELIKSLLSFSINSVRPLPELIEEWIPKQAERTPDIMRIAASYEQKKRERNVLDFDDLLALWLRVLAERPEVRASLGGQIEYILVDEYQDTNRLQGLIVEQLAGAHKNVLVVGDDAQSIYAFRAATVENILRFPEVFPGTRTFRLEQNYRSTQAILDLANACILGNRRQFEKELKSARPSLPDGHREGSASEYNKPQLVGCADEIEEARFVAERVLAFHTEGESLLESAVLFRAAYHAMQLELELQKQRIPYIVRGGIRFFEQAHIKDIVAYLKVVSNAKDELAWQRVLKLEEGIGEKTAAAITEALKHGNKETLVEHAQKMLERVMQRVEHLKRTSGVDHMIDYLLEAFYEEYAEATFENFAERVEDIEQLARFAKSYTALEDFLADALLSEGFRGERTAAMERSEDKEYLVLSTIHQAKGLEWKNVFVIGLIDGQFPHYKSRARRDELEEERRLFYVAITRAKERLFLTYPLTNMGSFGVAIHQPSLFVRELDPALYKSIMEDEEAVIEVEQ